MDHEEPNPRKRLYIILAVAGVVLVAGALAARPAYHWFNQWRALQLVEASAQALQNHDVKSASEKADAAMHLWPTDARVARQEAKVLALQSPAAALPLWMQTWSLSHDYADLREVISSALNARNLPVAVDQFEILQKAQPQNPATWLLEAKIRFSQNQIPEALAIFRKVIEAGNAPPDAHLLYAQAAILSGDPAMARDGLVYLRTLTDRTDELGLDALRLLGSYPALNAGDAAAVAQKLQNHPLATRSDKLMALRLLGSLPGADEDSLIKAAHDLFPPNDPEAMHEVGLWLMRQHRYQAVLQLIDSKTAMTREDLFLLRGDAMAELGQWQAIETALNDPSVPLPDEIRLLLQARTLTMLKEGSAADLAWQRVLNAVSSQPAKLLDVAQYAMKLKLYNYARPAFEQLLDHPAQRRTAYQQLILIDQVNGQTDALHQLLLDMAKAYPDDPLVRNDLLYTGFLLGDAGPDKIEAARKLIADSKTPYLSYRVTLALGLLTAGQPAEALKAFADVADSTWPVTTNSWNAVYVGVLRANGAREKASKIEQYVNADALLPQEKKLLLTPLPNEALP